MPTCTRQPRVETRSCIGVEGEENWRDEVQKEWEGVMVLLKRCPKLEWRASDDKLVTIFNRLAHQQDNGGNQCVATTHRLVARSLWTECEDASGHDTCRQET